MSRVVSTNSIVLEVEACGFGVGPWYGKRDADSSVTLPRPLCRARENWTFAPIYRTGTKVIARVLKSSFSDRRAAQVAAELCTPKRGKTLCSSAEQAGCRLSARMLGVFALRSVEYDENSRSPMVDRRPPSSHQSPRSLPREQTSQK